MRGVPSSGIMRLGWERCVQGRIARLQVQSAVLHTSSSLCNIDFGAPPPAEVPKRKLRRMAGGNPEALGRAGQNFRVFALENPCLLCEYTGSKAVLLVRRSLFQCRRSLTEGQECLGNLSHAAGSCGPLTAYPLVVTEGCTATSRQVHEGKALQHRACASPDCAAFLHDSLLPLSSRF